MGILILSDNVGCPITIAVLMLNCCYSYDDFRNLASRTEWKYATPMTETFKYDNLDRLDTVLFNNTVSRMAYDAYGRMLAKTSGGNVVFSNAYYNDQSKPHAVRGAEINGNMFANAPQTIDYTIYDKVKRIEQGDDVLTIDYGCDRQRIGMAEWIESFQTTAKVPRRTGLCCWKRQRNRRLNRPCLTKGAYLPEKKSASPILGQCGLVGLSFYSFSGQQ